jgi:hypothetical protein
MLGHRASHERDDTTDHNVGPNVGAEVVVVFTVHRGSVVESGS